MRKSPNAYRLAARRRRLALLAALLIALALIGAIRLATRPRGDYLARTLPDGTLEITRYRGGAVQVEIPAEIGGKRVTRIGEKVFFWRIGIASVALPEGLKQIGAGAFEGCVRLEGVTIPEGVEVIGADAFAYCRALTSAALPDSLKALGSGAFAECALNDIALPAALSDIGDNPFRGCARLERVRVDGGNPSLTVADGALRAGSRLVWAPMDAAQADIGDAQVIGGDAFNGSALGAVALPGGVTEIGSRAFSGCAALEEAVLPAGLRRVGDAAFAGCARLEAVEIPDGVEAIGYLAFYDCRALTRVTLPESVTAIGNGAFIGCPQLTVIAPAGSLAERWCRLNGVPTANP